MRKSAKRFFRSALGLLAIAVIVGISFAVATALRRHNTSDSSDAAATSVSSDQQRLLPDNANDFSPAEVSKEKNMQQPVDSNGNVTSPSVVNHTSIMSTTSGSRASVSVNGKSIKLPKNGIVDKTISSPNGETNVNIRVSGNGENETDGSSSTSLNLHVSSNSSSSN